MSLCLASSSTRRPQALGSLGVIACKLPLQVHRAALWCLPAMASAGRVASGLPAGSTMLEAWSLCWRAACTKPSLFMPWMLAYTAGTVHVQVAVMESHMMPVWRGLWRSLHRAFWWKQGWFQSLITLFMASNKQVLKILRKRIFLPRQKCDRSSEENSLKQFSILEGR